MFCKEIKKQIENLEEKLNNLTDEQKKILTELKQQYQNNCETDNETDDLEDFDYYNPEIDDDEDNYILTENDKELEKEGFYDWIADLLGLNNEESNKENNSKDEFEESETSYESWDTDTTSWDDSD